MSRKINLIVLAACCGMLIALANPPRAGATVTYTSPPTYSSATLVADDITFSNFISTTGGTFTQTAGSLIDMAGTNSIGDSVTALSQVRNNNYFGFGTFTTTQTGGTFSMPYWYQNAGSYTLNGGAISNANWFMIQSGSFTMNGGSLSSTNFGFVASGGGIGPNGTTTFILNAGTVTTGGGLFVGNQSTTTDRGVAVQEAGASVTLNGTNAPNDGLPGIFRISKPGGTASNGESSYTLKGGALSIPNGNTNIYQWGKLAGYGTLGTTSARTLHQSGKVVADGYGSDANILNLSQFGTVVNDTNNGVERTGAGWYAQNHGKLTLPSVSAVANGTVNWGETSSDATIDLVNSVQMITHNITGGSVSIALLSPDRADVPAGAPRPFIGVWDMSGASVIGSGSVDLTFRYDNVAAGNPVDPGALRLYHFFGGNWVDITTSVSIANSTITALGVTSFSDFAIGVPEPTSLALLALAPLALMRRKRHG